MRTQDNNHHRKKCEKAKGDLIIWCQKAPPFIIRAVSLGTKWIKWQKLRLCKGLKHAFQGWSNSCCYRIYYLLMMNTTDEPSDCPITWESQIAMKRQMDCIISPFWKRKLFILWITISMSHTLAIFAIPRLHRAYYTKNNNRAFFFDKQSCQGTNFLQKMGWESGNLMIAAVIILNE